MATGKNRPCPVHGSSKPEWTQLGANSPCCCTNLNLDLTGHKTCRTWMLPISKVTLGTTCWRPFMPLAERHGSCACTLASTLLRIGGRRALILTGCWALHPQGAPFTSTDSLFYCPFLENRCAAVFRMRCCSSGGASDEPQQRGGHML